MNSWYDEMALDAQAGVGGGYRPYKPKIEMVLNTRGWTEKELTNAGYKVTADVDGVNWAWIEIERFDTFVMKQAEHKKTISNIKYLHDGSK